MSHPKSMLLHGHWMRTLNALRPRKSPLLCWKFFLYIGMRQHIATVT